MFARLKTKDRELAMRVAKAMCQRVTQFFRDKLGDRSRYSLEFEKLLDPFLGVNQKRYVGLYWTKLDAPDMVGATLRCRL